MAQVRGGKRLKFANTNFRPEASRPLFTRKLIDVIILGICKSNELQGKGAQRYNEGRLGTLFNTSRIKLVLTFRHVPIILIKSKLCAKIHMPNTYVYSPQTGWSTFQHFGLRSRMQPDLPSSLLADRSLVPGSDAGAMQD